MREDHYKIQISLAGCVVVFCIAGGGLGLLTMAIRSAHESARAMSCSNNLKQLGVALHEYHDTYQVFPPTGYYLSQRDSNNPYTRYRTGRGGRLLRLYPYMESSAIYDHMDSFRDMAGAPTVEKGGFNRVTFDNLDWAKRGPKPSVYADEVRHFVIPSYLCPSSNFGRYAGIGDDAPALSNYAFSIGAQKMSSRDDCCSDYPGDFFGTGNAEHGETTNGDLISGPFSRSTWSACFRDLVDGQSQTILAGEVLPQKSSFMLRGWMHCDANWAATTSPINYPTRNVSDSQKSMDCHRYDNIQTSQGFKSMHKGGANFVMGDGSIQFLTDAMDYRVYQQLGDRRDGGEVIQFPVGQFPVP